MIPVLVVDGKPKEVVDITFSDGKPLKVITYENGCAKAYCDKSVDTYVEAALKVDLKDSLFWQGRYDEPYKSIHSLIEDNEKELIQLSTQIVEEIIQYPCTTPSLIEEYKKLKHRIFGLIDARDILEESMMIEDVDLTGGDDIAD